eukprot:m.239331 g.239331  ORF g.239331 m.239331 type:complete len:304 (+) comp10916_c0_seq36:5243-6154(+)
MAGTKAGWARTQLFVAMFVGYAAFTLARKTVSLTAPQLIAARGLSMAMLGALASGFSLAYAAGKFAAGILSDHKDPRLLFVGGLVASALCNWLFTLAASDGLLLVIWMTNGFAGGFGWPPCAYLLRKWYTSQELGFWWSVLSTSANLAAMAAPILAAAISSSPQSWHQCFQAFSLVAVAASVLAAFALPSQSPLRESSKPVPIETPDEPDSTPQRDQATNAWSLARNPLFVQTAAAYILVNFVRFAVADWTILYLMNAQRAFLPDLSVCSLGASHSLTRWLCPTAFPTGSLLAASSRRRALHV